MLHPACPDQMYHVQDDQAGSRQQDPGKQGITPEIIQESEEQEKQDPEYAEDIGQQDPRQDLGFRFAFQSEREKFEYFLLNMHRFLAFKCLNLQVSGIQNRS
jgi:hypothetical protein